MRNLKFTVAALLMGLIGCKKNEKQAETEQTETAVTTVKTTAEADKTAIETLVKDMYQWNEKYTNHYGFEPIAKDGKIIGYNMDSHKLYLEELRKSGFFSEEFISNMDKIAKAQNELLSSGKIKWEEGDMSPFGGDLDVWCGCQDVPADDAYSKITLHFDELKESSAKFYWNWESFGKDWADQRYHMRAVKEDGKWKIDYMQGWDYAANLGVE